MHFISCDTVLVKSAPLCVQRDVAHKGVYQYLFYVSYLAGADDLHMCQPGKLVLFLQAQYVPISCPAYSAIYIYIHTASGQFIIAPVKENDRERCVPL